MNKKILTLIIFAILLIIIGVGAYFVIHYSTPSKINQNLGEGQKVNLNLEDDNLILINGGTFTMGSKTSERQRGEDEKEHQVTISNFYVDPYEVTQKSYQEVMENNPSTSKGENLPVENVTWYEAIEYCNKLSEQRDLTPVYQVEGKKVVWNLAANGYRLLTEAEWEYVARAGSTSPFSVGDYIYSEQANFYGRYPYLIEENYTRNTNSNVKVGSYRGTTLAVNELGQNSFGLYHIHGNVSEWVFDYYGEYDLENTDNPTGANKGTLRVNRGGGFNDYGKHLRSAYRSATNPEHSDKNLGFRIARSSVGEEKEVVTEYPSDITLPENPKILIAYYSYSGNSKNTANDLKNELNADMVEIEMEQAYSGNIYDVSAKALNNYDKPVLKTKVDNMNDYDVILLGYPNWWATIPMPIVSFLESYDFSGKIVIPFCSHGSGEFGDSVSDIAKLVPNSVIGKGLEYEYSGGSDLSRRITEWLKDNHLKD